MNKSNITRFFAMAAMIVCGISAGIASNPGSPSTPSNPPAKPPIDKDNSGKLEREYNPKRHRASSSVYLTYEYMGEGIYVYPAESYFEYEVTVSGLYDGFECSASMSPDEGYYIETGALQGEYSISAVTPDGVVFSGTLSVE